MSRDATPPSLVTDHTIYLLFAIYCGSQRFYGHTPLSLSELAELAEEPPQDGVYVGGTDGPESIR